MTKERKLAIEMWETVRQAIINSDGVASVKVVKREFCTEHNLNWEADCWFCQYVGLERRFSIGFDCTRCPLAFKGYDSQKHIMGCGGGSLWSIVVNFDKKYSVRKRIKACNKIIKALGGKV